MVTVNEVVNKSSSPIPLWWKRESRRADEAHTAIEKYLAWHRSRLAKEGYVVVRLGGVSNATEEQEST